MTLTISDYADDGYQDNAHEHVVVLHGDEGDYEAFCHPIQNHGCVGDDRHEHDYAYDLALRDHANGCVIQSNADKYQSTSTSKRAKKTPSVILLTRLVKEPRQRKAPQKNKLQSWRYPSDVMPVQRKLNLNHSLRNQLSQLLTQRPKSAGFVALRTASRNTDRFCIWSQTERICPAKA